MLVFRLPNARQNFWGFASAHRQTPEYHPTDSCPEQYTPISVDRRHSKWPDSLPPHPNIQSNSDLLDLRMIYISVDRLWADWNRHFQSSGFASMNNIPATKSSFAFAALSPVRRILTALFWIFHQSSQWEAQFHRRTNCFSGMYRSCLRGGASIFPWTRYEQLDWICGMFSSGQPSQLAKRTRKFSASSWSWATICWIQSLSCTYVLCAANRCHHFCACVLSAATTFLPHSTGTGIDVLDYR